MNLIYVQNKLAALGFTKIQTGAREKENNAIGWLK